MTDDTRLPRALRPFANGQFRLLAAALVLSLLSVGVWIVASVWQVIAARRHRPPTSRSSPPARASVSCCRC